MKDIIRQAVADAAEWLHQNRSSVGSEWLKNREPEDIIRVCKIASDHDARTKRTEQLADFVANPIMPPAAALAARKTFTDNAVPALAEIARRVDSVLIAGPEGEIARTGGFVDRACEVLIECFSKSRKQTADAAQFLWMHAPLHYSQGFLMHCPPGKIMYEAGRDFSPVVAGEGYSSWIERGKNLHAITGGSTDGLAQWVGPTPSKADEHRWQSFKVPSDKAAASSRDFNKEVLLPAPKDPSWSVPVTVAYDGAEGEGRVWLSTQEEDEPMIAIEGRENAATLASMLIDWVQPDVVVVPRALLERLASGIPDFNAMDELRALLK